MLVAATGGLEAARRLALTLAGLDAGPDVIRLAVLIGLGEGLPALREVDPATLVRRTPERSAPFFERAAADATGTGTPGDRVEAIRLLGLGPGRPALDDPAAACSTPAQPAEVQLAALRALGGPAVAGGRPGRSPAAWRALGPGGPSRGDRGPVGPARADRLALLDAIEAGTIAPGELDPARREQLLELGNRGDPRSRRAVAGRRPASIPTAPGVIDALPRAPSASPAT